MRAWMMSLSMRLSPDPGCAPGAQAQVEPGATDTVLLLSTVGGARVRIWELFWPAILILVGTRLVMQAVQVNRDPAGEAPERLTMVAVLSHAKWSSTGRFRGGELTFSWTFKALSVFGSHVVFGAGFLVAGVMTASAWRLLREERKLPDGRQGTSPAD